VLSQKSELVKDSSLSLRAALKQNYLLPLEPDLLLLVIGDRNDNDV
jgi:hypothetical protein